MQPGAAPPTPDGRLSVSGRSGSRQCVQTRASLLGLHDVADCNASFSASRRDGRGIFTTVSIFSGGWFPFQHRGRAASELGRSNLTRLVRLAFGERPKLRHALLPRRPVKSQSCDPSASPGSLPRWALMFPAYCSASRTPRNRAFSDVDRAHSSASRSGDSPSSPRW
jgi:hypothetical protein